MSLKVTGLHPKLADAVSQLLNEAKARGLSVGLHSGLRGEEEQTRLYWKGRKVVNPDGASAANPMGRIVTNAIGPFGFHCLGLAADVVFKDSKGVWTWDDKLPWEELGKIGEIFGLSWGGRWKNPDRPHFELLPKTQGQKLGIIAAVELARKDGIEALWSLA